MGLDIRYYDMYLRLVHVPRRYGRHSFFFLLAVTLVILYHIQDELFRPRLEHLVIYEDYELGFRDPNVSCKFPLYHPFDPSILNYIHIPASVVCFSSIKPFMHIDEYGYLSWNLTAIEKSGYNIKKLYCTYKEIWRPEYDDFNIYYDEAKPFYERVKLKSDFVYVQCDNWFNLPVYRDFLAHTQKRIDIPRKYKDGEYDVLIIGLDSVSRLNFMRQLPKAYKLLTGYLDATVLIGFNKVGHNTFPNVVPMLTGRPLFDNPYDYFEEWPFVWKDFADVGAVTMYSEDLPFINMFNYVGDGISIQPTHHYMHTYWLAVEESYLLKSSSRLCLGPRPKHEIFFSYLKSFLKTYSDQPKFLFSLLNEPSHDYANTVGVIDDVLTEFLNSSYNEGLFNRSVVFVLGDHGNRLDSIRSTEIGKIEDYMPMVAAIVPPGANHSWKKHLKMNSNRFTSTYDLYQTFVEVLETLGGKPGFPGNSSRRVYKYFSQPPRGHSLFKEIPLERDCEDANVPEWYCTCNKKMEIPKTDLEAKRVALIVINHINLLLKNYTLCETLSLKEIKRVLEYSRDTLQITFYAHPSGALFQASVKRKWGSYKIGDLERINRYGTQSSCLGKRILNSCALLKALCFCKENR